MEIAEKWLVFKPVNYDQPENAHFLGDYKLPCPSLVVVRQKGGKDERWKLLKKTWEHVENPIQFNEYVETKPGSSGPPLGVASRTFLDRRFAGSR